MTRTMVNVTLAVLLGAAGCEQSGDEEQAAAETAEAEAEAPEEAAEDEPAEPEVEAEDQEGAEAAEAPSEPGQEVGFSELVDGFAASKDEWMGKKVTLTARYMNANSANGKLQNIALVESEE